MMALFRKKKPGLRSDETTLAESEKRWRSLVELHPEPIFVLIDGQIVYANPACAMVTGMKHSKDLLGVDVADLMQPAQHKVYRERSQALEAGNSKAPFEYQIVRPDGQQRILKVHSVPVFYEGKRAIQAVVHDITKQREAEENLRHSKTLLAEAEHIAQTGTWEWDIATGNRRWSDELFRIYGLDPETVTSSYETFFNRVHPDDQLRVDAARDHYFTDKEPLIQEFRIIRLDGEERLVWSKSTPMRNAAGEVVRVIGVVQDITTRREAEQAIGYRDDILRAAGFAAEQFLKSPDWELCIDKVLAYLGEATNVSRVYLFENHEAMDGSLLTSQRYEWTAPGMLPMIDEPDLQNIHYQEDGFGRWQDTLERGEVLYGLVDTFPETEAAFLRMQNILSIVVLPIFLEKYWWGFIGFDACINEREWTDAEVETLRVAASTLGAAIERRENEKLLAEREERWRNMVANSSDLVTLLAADGTIFYQSDSIVRILGYQQDELTGHLSLDFVHPDDRMYVAGSLARSVANQEAIVILTYRFKKANGSWCYLESIGTNLLDQPALRCIVVNSRDVTKRVMYQDELIAAKEQAEEMSRLKSTFLTNMSHEIRTPLTGIIGAADVLHNAYHGDLHQFINIIGDNGKRLLETLNSVLDLAQLEGNAVTFERVAFDLVEEVHNTVTLFDLQAHNKGLDLKMHLPESVPMLTSRNLIQRILTNLLSNAIKFTEEGAITVTVEADDTAATICVQDTGIGIRENFLPHVFDEFKQESTGLTRSYQGNGLGLAISKRIVRLLKGTISVTSEHGAGTRFTVQLPLELPTNDQDLSNHYNE